MRIVMTLLVRDEEDVIGANLDFHLSQGVDHFIITDNLSVDRTADSILPYIKKGLVSYRYESQDLYLQGQWVTDMARQAATEQDADWVINADADEFWMPVDESQTLKTIFASTPGTTFAIEAPRFNCPPTGVEASALFPGKMVYREKQSFNLCGEPLPPKVCHRASPDIEVAYGNHAVGVAGAQIVAESGQLLILHYPLRSYRQFENKIIKGGAALSRNATIDSGVGHVWRNLNKHWEAHGNLLGTYMQNVLGQSELEERVVQGDLIQDDRVALALSSVRRQSDIRCE